MGALNGLLVVRLRITPVIATLVTLNLFKGIALLIVAGWHLGHQKHRHPDHARLDQRFRP